MMKHVVPVTAAILLLPLFQLGATDISVTGKTSAFNFNAAGVPDPAQQRWGYDFYVEDQLTEALIGKIAYDCDPENGSTLSARASYRTSYLEISAGPTFGILNSSSSGGVANLFQPGLGIGFKLLAPGQVVAKADTDFALPAPASSTGQIFLQRSELSIGFYLPNVLCSVGIKQKTNTESGGLVKGITDVGLYTESFKKGSPFRISVDFIYRVMDYYVASGSASNTKTAHLVLGGGLTWEPKNDLSLFIEGDGAIYSYSLGGSLTGLDKFLFDVRAGVLYRLDTSKN